MGAFHLEVHLGADRCRRVVAHRLRQAVKDGVDDAAVLQHDDDTRRQAYHHSGREDVAHALNKELGNVTGALANAEAAAHAHKEKECGDLHDVPAIAQHAYNQVINRTKQQGQDEIGHGLPQSEKADQNKQTRANGQKG